MIGAAALKWAGVGRPVFPIEPRGKRPLTPRGFLDATTDPERIRQWWQRWPDANLALRCGAPSGLVVLDVDGEEGAEALRELERTYSDLPRTASAMTPRGGAHYYFLHPGREVRNSAGKLGPGLDVRGDGGYVLLPPSMGANGRAYCWDEETPPVPLPAWLAAATTHQEARRAPTPVSEWLTIVRNGLPAGQRNSGLVRLVGHLLARNVDARLVAEIAHLVNTRNQPPLTAAEVDRAVESIAGAELRKRARRKVAA